MNTQDKLRYVELPPERIFNWLGIENVTCWFSMREWHDTWWKPETLKLREEFARCWIEAFDDITGHYTKLRDSIQKEGIKRPISVMSGPGRMVSVNKENPIGSPVPPEYHKRVNELIYTKPFGGSRLFIASELGIKTIPCAIHDLSDLFPNAERITPDNFRNWFGNEYMFRGRFPHLSIGTHSHLKHSKKYRHHSGDAKRAQRQASKIARRKMNV